MSNIDWNRIAYLGDKIREKDYYEVGDYNLMNKGYDHYLIWHSNFKHCGKLG